MNRNPSDRGEWTVSVQRLIERARDGARAALEELLVHVQPMLYRFSAKMCGHKEDTEDVLQDSLLSVVKSLSAFRAESSFSTWLFTIAWSCSIKKRRRENRNPAIRREIFLPIFALPWKPMWRHVNLVR